MGNPIAGIKVTVEESEGGKLVKLAGTIDESWDHAQLVVEGELAKAGRVIVDFSETVRINSLGVRNWIYFLTTLEQAGAVVRLQACPQPIVHQLNMISTFRGHAEVHSILAPFYCDECGAEEVVPVEIDDDVESKLVEGHECKTCGAEMEFDDIPGQYLAFRRST